MSIYLKLMVRHVLWTVYSCVFGHTNSHEESCYHYRMWLRPIWLHLDTNFVKCKIYHSLAFLWLSSLRCFRRRFKQCSFVWATRKRYQDIRRALRNDKTSVPKCERAYGVCKLKDTTTDHYILCVVTFCFIGTIEWQKKTCCEKAGSIWKLNLLIKDKNI